MFGTDITFEVYISNCIIVYGRRPKLKFLIHRNGKVELKTLKFSRQLKRTTFDPKVMKLFLAFGLFCKRYCTLGVERHLI